MIVTKRFLSFVFFLWVQLPFVLTAQDVVDMEQIRDSVVKYGAPIEPYLQKISPGGQISEDINYSPYINEFLRNHQYVIFPPYLLTVGIDQTIKGNSKMFISPNSGNRLFFPTGGGFQCERDMKTNGYIVYVKNEVEDLFISGITILGAKSNPNYETSPYGSGISLFAPSNVMLENVHIKNSTGDGIAIRTQWRKQPTNVIINKALIERSTRVGMLITGIVNGRFSNITISGTGERQTTDILKPQTALSFEPNDCSSRYVNCRFDNLVTKDNLGPVVATANFSNMMVDPACSTVIDILIKDWTDYTESEHTYGATFDISTTNIPLNRTKYNATKVSGKFVIKRANWYRDVSGNNKYFILNNNHSLYKGVEYHLEEIKTYNRINGKYKQVDINTKQLKTPKLRFKL